MFTNWLIHIRVDGTVFDESFSAGQSPSLVIRCLPLLKEECWKPQLGVLRHASESGATEYCCQRDQSQQKELAAVTGSASYCHSHYPWPVVRYHAKGVATHEVSDNDTAVRSGLANPATRPTKIYTLISTNGTLDLVFYQWHTWFSASDTLRFLPVTHLVFC